MNRIINNKIFKITLLVLTISLCVLPLFAKESNFDEVKASKKFISDVEKITGKPTESMAYPFGVSTPKLDSILRNEMGFTTSFSTDPGILKGRHDFQKPIKRIYRNHGHVPQDMIDAINSYK